MMTNLKRGRAVVLWLATFVVFGSPLALAQEGEFAEFFRHDEASNLSFRYKELDVILDGTVIISGASERYRVREKKDKSTGSNLAGGFRSKTWLEGNRVLYDAYDDNGLQLLTQTRQTIEALPYNYPIETWGRDEQLAYWLNLYTIGVYEIVAREYPVQKLRRLREGKGSKPGAWDEKMFTVAGVPLSLNDIQYQIVMPQWKDPRVLYGFYQGTIGGPSIQSRAFMGKNVWRMLDRIGVDFVNSIRGVQKKGSTARASIIYEWGRDLFPDFDADLRAHLAIYADDKTRKILDDTRKTKADFYDWIVADLHRGRPRDRRSGMLSYGTTLLNVRDDNDALGRVSSSALPSGNLGGLSDLPFSGLSANNAFNPLSTIPGDKFPEHTKRYLRAMNIKFRKFGFPNTRIEISEIERERGDRSEDIVVVPDAGAPDDERREEGAAKDNLSQPVRRIRRDFSGRF